MAYIHAHMVYVYAYTMYKYAYISCMYVHGMYARYVRTVHTPFQPLQLRPAGRTRHGAGGELIWATPDVSPGNRGSMVYSTAQVQPRTRCHWEPDATTQPHTTPELRGREVR